MTYFPTSIKSVQKGTINLSAGVGSNTATISSVNTAAAVVVYEGSFSVSGSIDSGSGFIRLDLTNATTVTATRANTAGSMTVKFMVIEFVPFFVKSLQKVSISCASASNTATITSVNTAKAVVFFGGSTTSDTVSGLASNWFAGLDLTNATTVTATYAGSNTVVINGTVVEFR